MGLKVAVSAFQGLQKKKEPAVRKDRVISAALASPTARLAYQKCFWQSGARQPSLYGSGQQTMPNPSSALYPGTSGLGHLTTKTPEPFVRVILENEEQGENTSPRTSAVIHRAIEKTCNDPELQRPQQNSSWTEPLAFELWTSEFWGDWRSRLILKLTQISLSIWKQTDKQSDKLKRWKFKVVQLLRIQIFKYNLNYSKYWQIGSLYQESLTMRITTKYKEVFPFSI